MANTDTTAKPTSNDLSEMANEDIAYVGAYRERARLFEKLGNQSLSDDDRKEVRKAYADASANFDKLRATYIKPKG